MTPLPSRCPSQDSSSRPAGIAEPAPAGSLARLVRVPLAVRIPLACALLALGACGTIAPQASGDGAPVPGRADGSHAAHANGSPTGAATPADAGLVDTALLPEGSLPEGALLADTGTTLFGGTEPVHVEEADALEPVGNLWDRIRAGFAMPELDSKLVATHERRLLARPDYLERMIERSRPYLFHIVDEVEKRGLPTELALLPFIESAMNPGATSHAKAAGLWQFIPSTGRAYDLKQNWWVDNRRDVVQSTRAALDYLEYIHGLNDQDWFLALASYNWGEGAVARARKANRARGRPDGYLHLRMPKETRHYVPKLIALKNIVARAESLSLPLAYLPDKPYFVTIDKLRPMDLELAARFAGMSVEEFVTLNPAHHRPVISASRDHSIVLPADRLAGFVEAVAQHEAANGVFASWQPYTLQKGDTLSGVAVKFSVTVAELRKANGLRPNSKLLAGSQILAPHQKVLDETRIEKFAGAKLVERVETPARYYTPKRQQSLTSIAKRWGVSTRRLRSMNGLGSKVTTVRAGTRLKVRAASVSTVVTDANGRRRVASTQVAARTRPATAGRSSGSSAKTPVTAVTPARATGTARPAARTASARALRISNEEPPAKRPSPTM
ncbi:MAG: transglycosylase SLT domain-containing protein [Burkholderiaceae bacterium]